MSATLMITCFQRDELLRKGLWSIKRQPLHLIDGLRILVINDGLPCETKSICDEYGVDYLYTGQRNEKKIHWRMMGYPINYAVKHHVDSDIIMISSPEIWHVNDAILPLVSGVESDPDALTIPEGREDKTKLYIENLDSQESWNKCITLNTKIPFLMAFRRDRFMDIGGYDEEFTGSGFEDNDIVDRLVANGGHFVQTESKIVHLYHGSGAYRHVENKRAPGRYEHNMALYRAKKGIINRNVGVEWGENTYVEKIDTI